MTMLRPSAVALPRPLPSDVPLDAGRRLEGFAETASAWLWETDAELRVTWIGGAFERLTGLRSDAARGADVRELIQRLGNGHPFAADVGLALSNCRGYRNLDYVVERGAAGARWFRSSAAVRLGPDGAFGGLRGVEQDVTDICPVSSTGAAAGGPGRSEERLRLLIEHAPVCIHEIDPQGRLRSMNRAGLRMLGADDEAQIRGVPYLDFVEERDRTRIGGLLERAVAGESCEFEFCTAGEPPQVFASLLIPIRDDRGELVGLMGISQELTEGERTRAMLEEKSALLETTLEHMDQGISLVDADMRVVAFNRKFLQMLEFPPETFTVGDDYERFARFNATRGEYGPGDVDALVARCMAWAADPRPERTRRTRPNGTVIEYRRTPVAGGGFVTTYTDVTATHQLSEQLEHQASHDPLTGMFNRGEFERRLAALLAATAGSRAEHALCYLDLDQFQVINDTCGHGAGDELLRQLAKLLSEQLRRSDVFARLGGDEFGLLIEHCGQAAAAKVAEKLRATVETFVFVWDDMTFQVGVSIGLVAMSGGESVTEVLSRADAACFVAKDLGRSRVHVHQAGDAHLARRHDEMHWVARLTRAINEDRLRLFYQRIVPVSADAGSPPLHYEILLRLEDDDGDLVSPGAFLPAAERFNLMGRIDRRVIEITFDWLSAHPDHLASLETCSINLSGQSLGDPGLVDFVIRRLGQVRPEQICFEITETAAVGDLPAAQRFIEALQAEGCRFALDDFGSGLASFGYLRSLPVDYLKIDGVFVRDMAEDPIDRAMVKSINEIGQTMGKRTIAEFVEGPEVLRYLREIGVDFAQGYGVHAPEPLEHLA